VAAQEADCRKRFEIWDFVGAFLPERGAHREGAYCAVAPILPAESVRRTAGSVALCAPKERVRKSRAVSGLIRKMCDGTRATGNS